MTLSTAATPANTIVTFVGVVTDTQTYRNLLYLTLAFPLGLAYYMLLTIGFTLGIGLSVILVGLGVLLGTVIGLRYIAAFERKLANALLGTTIPEPNDVESDRDGIIAAIKAYLGARSTWTGLAFVALKFWFGILAFVLLVAFLGTGIELLVLPVFPGGVLNVQVGEWVVAESIETTTHRLAAVPVGAVVVVVSFHVLNAVAGVSASVASSLLGPSSAGD